MLFFQNLLKRLQVLIDHEKERKLDQKMWMANQVLVVGFIQKWLGIKDEDYFSDAAIQRAIGDIVVVVMSAVCSLL